MLTAIGSTAVYTLVQGFCFNVLLPAWALLMPFINAFLGI